MPVRMIEVYADTEGSSPCRDQDCTATLLWAVVVKSGKRMCFTGKPVVLKTRHDESGRLIHSYDFNDNHWASCPGSKRFKARG